MKTYQQLIKDAYDRLDKKTEKDFFVNNSNYERLEEHNLWTYWQGRGVRHPKIMVVGQDWGSVEQSNKYFEYIKNNPDAEVVSYVQIKENNPIIKNSEFTTDRELKRFFCDYLGYSDICSKAYDDIYFTNLISGFRQDSSSTGNSSKVQNEMTAEVIKEFKRLLTILQPQIIISLGRIVAEAIDKAYNKEESIIAKSKNYNEFLEQELYGDVPKPILLDFGNGHHAKMFALAHMGSLGKANRTKFYKNKDNKKTVENDWKVVADYINAI